MLSALLTLPASAQKITTQHEVVQGVKEIPDTAVPKALKPITRMADSVDIRRMRQNREDEKRAYRTCQECIARHGLEMKLVEAEYTLDRSKIMFYFTADGRVDFRELVKDLAGIFHTRISSLISFISIQSVSFEL